MKRINPDTGELFKRQDKRPLGDKQDGKLFWQYAGKVRQRDGFNMEHWVTPERYEEKNERTKVTRHRREIKFNPKIHKKRKNPKTGKYFVRGDIENGKYFLQYKYIVIKSTGYCQESWGSKDVYHAHVLSVLAAQIKYRAEAKKLDFDLDRDYLLSIFPKDFKCPILGIDIFWGSRQAHTNPSLDRIDNSKGYIKGNVIWISYRANRIKSDSTLEELNKITDFYNNLATK